LQDMAAGRLDGERVREAAEVLLEHRRHELPSVSVAVAARLPSAEDLSWARRQLRDGAAEDGVLLRARHGADGVPS
jgi:hypothetical protein